MWAFRQPAWWLLLLFMLAETGFLAAARWQWQRGVFKDRRDREFQQALAATDPAFVHDFPTLGKFAGDFVPARLRGRLLTDHVYLHDNRMVEGAYGVDVFVPLAIEGGHVLVNFGWIPADRSRREAPKVPPVDAHFDRHGLLAPPPAAGVMAGNVPPPQADRPSLRLNIDLAAVARESGLQPMSERVFWPAPEAGSEFRRDWRPPGLSGDRHRGYALQWASFAAACLVLFLIFHVRRKESAR